MNVIVRPFRLRNTIWLFSISLLFVATASEAQPTCQSDYDCRSDGKYNCGIPVNPAISFRRECLCYQKQCVDYGEVSKRIEAEKWPLEDCQSTFASVKARNMCIRAVALSQNNYVCCEQISDPNLTILGDACIRDVARKMKELSLCEHIHDTWQHGLCVTYIAEDAGNVTLCKSLEGQSRGLCFESVAVKMDNVKLCDEAGEYQSGCTSQVKTANKN